MSALPCVLGEDKSQAFNMLLNSVQNCDLCERMCNRKKVLSTLNGSLNSKVVFIAEAPGRLGADCTGVPLLGDKTGENFDLLLNNIGWNREDVFITNSILCNPQDEVGNNATPTKQEVLNCSYYLEMTLALINPDVIVTLGIKALESLKIIHSHNYKLSEDVGKCLNWGNRKLVPLYHMGPRAIIHRSIIKQRGDFIALSHIVDPINGLKKQEKKSDLTIHPHVSTDQLTSQMLEYIIFRVKKVSMFMATKIMYLADYTSQVNYGSTISNNIYLRMQEGPWIPTLNIVAKQLDRKYFATKFERKKPYFYYISNEGICDFSLIEPKKLEILDKVIMKYKDCSDATIKIATYRTEPMKYILQQEKAGRKMTKIPVIYKNKLVMEFDIERNII